MLGIAIILYFFRGLDWRGTVLLCGLVFFGGLDIEVFFVSGFLGVLIVVEFGEEDVRGRGRE